MTFKELAKMLSVSPSAVSIAMNGKPGVSNETRKKILDAAEQYGLKTKTITNSEPKNRTIRYIIYSSNLEVVSEISFHSIVLRGIEAQAKELGYNVLVSYLSPKGDENISSQILSLSQEIDGILLLGSELKKDDPIILLFNNLVTCPYIVIDCNLSIPEIDCICTDNFYGAASAIQYLYDHGHRNIGYFSSIQRIPNFDERNRGVLYSLTKNENITFTNIPVNFGTNKAYDDICKWIQNKHLKNESIPTAFFSDSDIIAFGAIQAFSYFGYQIPKDISIIGFDDMPACSMVIPPLTTVMVQKIELGKYALSMLNYRIQFKIPSTEHFHTVINTRIKERQSVFSIK